MLHIAITIVLTVPPLRLPNALMSASGTESVLYERWLVIEALKMDFGASARFKGRALLAVRWLAKTPAAVLTAFAAAGNSSASLRYCCAEFSIAACSSSVTPSW